MTNSEIQSLPEREFDALTRVAGPLLGVPVAWLVLTDSGKACFKSQVGLNPSDLERGLAFCAQAHESGALLVCEDLSQDARFAQQAWVSDREGPRLRFYAGMPIVEPSGQALGTLAVADVRPRGLTVVQHAALIDLTSLALAALQGRRHAVQLSHLATTDHLTGISNRAQFDLALEVELRHAMRTGESFSVLCMDLDGFKEINDGFGHAAGDEVLCEVSRRLTQQVRLGDVLARFGGNQFGVVMRHGAQDSAQVLARRIVKAVSQPLNLSTGDTVGVGISVGIAAYTDAVASMATMLAQADQALYKAKKQNERRWNMFVGGR